MGNTKRDNCFREFDDISPRKQDRTIQVLYDYEKHYMELLKKYSDEISFIEGMLHGLREEQTDFYNRVLPEIAQKLTNDLGIDKEMRIVWLNRLETNMKNSFSLSEILLNEYAVKNINEFKTAVNEKLRNV